MYPTWGAASKVAAGAPDTRAQLRSSWFGARVHTAPLVVTLALNTRDERGASLVEYAFLVGLIAVVCVTAIAFFGSAVSNYLNITF